MRTHVDNFRRFQPLLYELVARDVKIKYRKSTLGILWSVLNPLLMMTVLSVVFSNLFRFNVDKYSLYILCGQTVFNFFNEATNNSMMAIIGNAPLIKKVYIPKYLFVLSKVASSIINLLAQFCALILVMFCSRIQMHVTMFFVFLPLIFLVLISLGVSLILATIAVRFRDIIHLYSVFTTALLYMMPVIYPLNILPAKILFVVKLNPLTNILTMFRDVLLYNTLPTLSGCLVACVECLAFLGIGLYVFYKQQDTFILNI